MLRSRRVVFLLLLLLLLPAVCCANVPLPTVFALDLPLWSGLRVFAIFTVSVLVIETLVLWLLFKLRAPDAFWSICKANFSSGVVGLLLSFHPLELIGLVVVPAWASGWARDRFKWTVGARVALALGLVVGLVAVLIPRSSITATVVQFYVTICAAFGLTLLFEALVFARKATPGEAWRRSLAVNGASYAALFVILLLMGLRSGAFAIREWHVWQIRTTSGTTPETHSRALRQLEEYYLWEQSGRGLSLGLGRYTWSPTMELAMVKTWADQGDTGNAAELMTMINQYNPERGPYDQHFWKQAEDAVSSAPMIAR